MREIESRRTLLVGGILLIVVSTLGVTALRNPVSLDAFWHLQMGRDWLVNGLSPWLDHYSYTFFEKPISNPPVFFQAFLHILTSELGIRNGFLVFKLLFFLLTIGTAFFTLRQMNAHPVMYAFILPMIAFLLQLRATVRPELVSYTLTVVALFFYFRAGNKASARNVLPMVALALLWTVYHNSSIIAYVVFAGYFLDCAVRQLRNGASASEWVRWLGLGSMTFAVGYLNPAISHPVIEAITFSPEWKSYISEYQFGPWLLKYPAIYVLLAMVAITPALAIVKKQFGFLMICLVLIYAVLGSARLISFSGIVISLLLARLITENRVSGSRERLSGRPGTLAGFVVLAVILAILASNVLRVQELMAENKQTFNRYPQALTHYMKAQKLSGRVHNEFIMGGYLLYQLAPQNQVYIDGRTNILYPVEHLKRFMATVAYPEVLRQELEKYDVDMVAWLYNDTSHDTVMSLGDFSLDFMDAGFALYIRGPGNFSLHGSLMWQPACWREELSGQLQAERRTMAQVLPWYSSLYPFANFVAGFESADSKTTFLNRSPAGESWTGEMRRFAGFRLMEAGQHKQAASIFAGIPKPKPRDVLAAAAAQLRAEDYESAARSLSNFANTAWPRIDQDDLEVLKLLFANLSQLGELQPGEKKVIEELGRILASYGPAKMPVDTPLNSVIFCPGELRPGRRENAASAPMD